MKINLLIKLANHLLNVVKDGQWFFDSCIREINSCGTVGCALGHCTTIFPDDFKYKIYEDRVLNLCDRNGDNINTRNKLIRYAADFFDISEDDSEYIFIEGAFRSPTVTRKDVVGRILSVVTNEINRNECIGIG